MIIYTLYNDKKMLLMWFLNIFLVGGVLPPIRKFFKERIRRKFFYFKVVFFQKGIRWSCRVVSLDSVSRNAKLDVGLTTTFGYTYHWYASSTLNHLLNKKALIYIPKRADPHNIVCMWLNIFCMSLTCPLREWIHLLNILPFSTREIAFVTTCKQMLLCTQSPFGLKGQWGASSFFLE